MKSIDGKYMQRELKLTPGKKLLFSAVIVLLCVMTAELAAFAGYSIMNGRLYSRSDIIDRMKGQSESASEFERNYNEGITGRIHLMKETIHPYLGFVLDPEASRVEVSPLGFLKSSETVIPKKADGKLIIGVLGGSFANSAFDIGIGTFLETLGMDGSSADVLNLALPGYKQPQQLMVLCYLLSMGAEFDVVINIDGFNEIVLPGYYNIPKGVFPLFPRAWHLRTDTAVNPETLKMVGRIALLDEKRKSWASFFERRKLYNSVSLSLLWMAGDRKLRREKREISELLEAGSELKATSYSSTGPDIGMEKEGGIEYLTECWVQSSIQIKRLCDANDIKYYHFLQPNQYVEGSKPMSDEERLLAVDFENPYSSYASEGYPYLIEAGEKLPASGVRYYDLTMLFRDREEILYDDSCCHLNKKGYAIVAGHIAGIIKADMKAGGLSGVAD